MSPKVDPSLRRQAPVRFVSLVARCIGAPCAVTVPFLTSPLIQKVLTRRVACANNLPRFARDIKAKVAIPLRCGRWSRARRRCATSTSWPRRATDWSRARVGELERPQPHQGRPRAGAAAPPHGGAERHPLQPRHGRQAPAAGRRRQAGEGRLRGRHAQAAPARQRAAPDDRLWTPSAGGQHNTPPPEATGDAGGILRRLRQPPAERGHRNPAPKPRLNSKTATGYITHIARLAQRPLATYILYENHYFRPVAAVAAARHAPGDVAEALGEGSWRAGRRPRAVPPPVRSPAPPPARGRPAT